MEFGAVRLIKNKKNSNWCHVGRSKKKDLEKIFFVVFLEHLRGGLAPLDIYLDQMVLRSRDSPRCVEVIKLARATWQESAENYVGKGDENVSLGLLPCQSRTDRSKKTWISYEKR